MSTTLAVPSLVVFTLVRQLVRGRLDESAENRGTLAESRPDRCQGIDALARLEQVGVGGQRIGESAAQHPASAMARILARGEPAAPGTPEQIMLRGYYFVPEQYQPFADPSFGEYAAHPRRQAAAAPARA